MKRKTGLFSALTATVVLLVSVALPANAAINSTQSGYSPECVSQVQAISASQSVPADISVCAVTTGTSVGAAVQVSKAAALADPNLSVANRAFVVNATTAITSKKYSQFTTGIDYTVTQGGTFYYNGSRAWVTVAYSGYTGSHNCGLNYAIVSVDSFSKSDTGSPTNRAVYCQWMVHRTLFGIGYNYTYGMTVNLSRTGGISGANSSNG